ncbi:hypothetical protein IAU59_004142 [Kwoniella sp. CBS 9459]
MDLVQNGESSKSPRLAMVTSTSTSNTNHSGGDSHMTGTGSGIGVGNVNGNGDSDIVMGDAEGGTTRGGSKLVLPAWDVPPQKPLHSSLDLISLLHLDTLYNTYVRPFADVRNDDQSQLNNQGEEDDKKPNSSNLGTGAGPGPGGAGGKKGQQKRRKMEKGYQHLIEDCIDPTPMGTKPDNLSLLPLVPDFGHGHNHHPSAPVPPLFSEAIQLLPDEAFQIARLEAGVKQDGYANGAKVGVREAEERRKKKRAAKVSVPVDLAASGGISSPAAAPAAAADGLPSPGLHGTQIHSPSASTPGTPLLPVPPPGPSRLPFPINTTRKPQPFPPQASAYAGAGSGGAGQGRPYAPFSKNKRPGSADVQSSTAYKRVKSGSVGPGSGSASKPGSRSASPMPMPTPAAVGTAGNGNGNGIGNGQGQSQVQRLKLKAGMRSKTEGVE